MFYTYQDLLKVADDDKSRAEFVLKVINNHKSSDDYKTAAIAEEYNKHKNVTITEYQKILYTVTGKAIPDNFSANFKMACRHFHRFITQENQFLLGNGASWDDDSIEGKLGTKKKPFDNQLQKLGKKALIQGVAYGFYDLDHIEIFALTEFAPLLDEENGALKAGVRFWQIDSTKPLRATLYELDGYTEYIWRPGEDANILHEKRPYKLNHRSTIADGDEVYSGENYPGFPIIPLWANDEKQSELVGLREQIDCYDLIKSGFANNVDEASFVYWTIQNAGGMDDVDLATFIKRMKTLHAATVDDDGARAESHQQEVPYASREALLTRLDRDLYRDAMALDVESIASGAATATQIRAAYEALNSKVDGFEYCVREFINLLLELVGSDAEVSFTRSMIVNTAEDINSILAAAPYLSESYIVNKLLDLLGDGDQVEDVLNERAEAELKMMGMGGDADESSESEGTSEFGEENSQDLQ